MDDETPFFNEAFWRDVANRRRNDPILQLRAQRREHDDVYMMGSRQGLLRLRAAIDEALATKLGVALVTTVDGEGYLVVVLRNDAPPINDAAAIMRGDAQFNPAWEGVLQTYREHLIEGNWDFQEPEPPFGLMSAEEYTERRERMIQQQREPAPGDQ